MYGGRDSFASVLGCRGARARDPENSHAVPGQILASHLTNVRFSISIYGTK